MKPRTYRRKQRGLSMVELVMSLLILGFLAVSASSVLNIVTNQQKLARGSSDTQTELRRAFRRATMGLRHGKGVIATSTTANFPTKTSSASQLILKVPEATGASGTEVEIRYHLNNGNFYRQRADESSPGVVLVEGVQSLAFKYYNTAGSTTTEVAANPDQANVVQITLTAYREKIYVRVSNQIALRNVLIQ